VIAPSAQVTVTLVVDLEAATAIVRWSSAVISISARSSAPSLTASSATNA
jgi:hypothetical protein